jgi:hypothetical protein
MIGRNFPSDHTATHGRTLGSGISGIAKYEIAPWISIAYKHRPRKVERTMRRLT